jgi:multiple sugar transport system substrate-binding protein
MFDPSISEVIGKIAIGPEPAQPGVAAATMTGNQLLGIPQGSKNQDRALDFIVWLTAPEQQKRMLLNDNVPATRISVLEDPEAVDKLPFLPGLLAAARNAVPRPRTELYPAVELILGGHLADALAGRASGEDALAAANAEIRAMMVREGVLEA